MARELATPLALHGDLATATQNTGDDRAQRASALLDVQVGDLLDAPTMGRPEWTGRTGGIGPAEAQAVFDQFDPGLGAVVTQATPSLTPGQVSDDFDVSVPDG